MATTYHDIIVDGTTYILAWDKPDRNEGTPSTIMITEGIDDTPCDWFINKATTPSWCCATHQFDGTGDYPANAGIVLPERCDFSQVNEDGEPNYELQTYDFTEDE